MLNVLVLVLVMVVVALNAATLYMSYRVREAARAIMARSKPVGVIEVGQRLSDEDVARLRAQWQNEQNMPVHVLGDHSEGLEWRSDAEKPADEMVLPGSEGVERLHRKVEKRVDNGWHNGWWVGPWKNPGDV